MALRIRWTTASATSTLMLMGLRIHRSRSERTGFVPSPPYAGLQSNRPTGRQGMGSAAAPFAGGAPLVFWSAQAGGAEFTVVAPTAATRRLEMTGMAISVDAPASVLFKDG